MTVIQTTAWTLIVEDTDQPGHQAEWSRDPATQRITVQVEGRPRLDPQDVLAILSWLAAAAGVERYAPATEDAWEWGVLDEEGVRVDPYLHGADLSEEAARRLAQAGDRVVRRRRASPWEPAPGRTGQ